MPFQQTAFVLALVLLASFFQPSDAVRPSQTPQRETASVAVLADGRGAPIVSFADGREIGTPFAADPLAMVSGDFDLDGTPDLAVGYETATGFQLAVYRGNVDAIFPNSAESARRKADGAFTDAAFLPVPRVFDLTARPSFLGAGDFDADGQPDIVAGDGASLQFLSGDGSGGFATADQLELPGTITALAVGEVNRRDLLEDLVVAVDGADGPRVLVFSAPDGARTASAETYSLPSPATAVVLGPVDGDWLYDVAVAAGNSLVLIEGRDGNGASRALTHRFADNLTSLALRSVPDAQHPRLVALTESGDLLSLADGSTPERRQGFASWRQAEVASGLPAGTRLVCAPATSQPGDATLIADAEGRSVRVLSGGSVDGVDKVDAAFEVDGEPIALLPMRLNPDAIADLVVIRRGMGAPATILSSPRLTFVVSTLAESGAGSLRDAINSANGSAGFDNITFSVSGTIMLTVPLPTISDTVAIDATTAPGYTSTPVVQIDGAAAGGTGIIVGTPVCSVRGLAISQFAGNGILISANNTIIESNFVGTNLAGTTALGNGSTGIQVNASNCTIGGTGAAGNLSSGNGVHGIAPAGGTSGNILRGNLIGTDVTGNSTIPNFGSGIDINNSSNNTIGGTAAGQRNIICGNFVNGITMFSNANSNVVQGNRIGVGAGGAALGNANQSIRMHLANNNTIGGLSAGAANIIGNNGNGVIVLQSTGDSIRGNSISGIGGLGIDLDDNGQTANDAGDGDSGGNNDQNYPVLTSALTSMSSTMVAFTLNSQAGTTFGIDFYRNTACDGSGFGEGEVYLGSTSAMTDGSGNVMAFANLPAVPVGSVITATATDPSGNTSEFSACIVVTGVADISAMINASPFTVPAGANLTFTVTVANGGPEVAVNPSFTMNPVSDSTFVSISAPGGWMCTTPPIGGTGPVSCTAPSLAASSNAVFSIVWNVDLDTPSGSTISGDVSSGSDTPDVNLVNNNDIIAVLTSTEADLSATLADSPDPVAAGTDIAYAIQVANAGPSNADVVVADFATPPGTTFVSASAPAGWSCTAPSVGGTGTVSCSTALLAPGGQASLLVIVHVNPNVAPASSIAASVTVSSATPDSTPGNNTGMELTTVGNIADLGVTRVAAPDTVMPSEDITSTITVTNAGPSDAVNATLSDATPANTTFVSIAAPAGWSCTTPGPFGTGPITCTAPSLPLGASVEFTLVVRVDFGTAAGTIVTGTSTVSSVGMDPNGPNDSASSQTTVTAPPVVDVSLFKSVTPESPAPSSAVTYSITATNDGPATANDVTIVDTLPGGVTFVSAAASAGGSITAPAAGATGTVTCVWPGATAVDESRSLTIVVQVGASIPDQTAITNSATVSNTVMDLDESNNQSSASLTVILEEGTPQADVSVAIQDAPTSVDTGTVLEYTIEVTNAGPDAAAGVTLLGSTPNGTRFVSLTTDQGTVTAPRIGATGTFSVAIGDLESAQIVIVTLRVNVVAEGGVVIANTVNITSVTSDPRPFNNQSAATTSVVAGLDTELSWDPPLACEDDCLNPPLHLQTSTAAAGGRATWIVRDPRATLVGYNIYRSNNPDVMVTPANFFMSVPASVTTMVVATAPGGSFFTVTAQYPNGESDSTNAASGGIPEPQITGFQIRGNKVIVTGTGFTDSVTVFIDGIPFRKGAKVKIENTRIVQKGNLLTGQSVNSYMTQQGGVILVSVLNTDTGIGTFLFQRE